MKISIHYYQAQMVELVVVEGDIVKILKIRIYYKINSNNKMYHLDH
jgi:hypothetical protein